jgi:hypothetical protein
VPVDRARQRIKVAVDVGDRADDHRESRIVNRES